MPGALLPGSWWEVSAHMPGTCLRPLGLFESFSKLTYFVNMGRGASRAVPFFFGTLSSSHLVSLSLAASADHIAASGHRSTVWQPGSARPSRPATSSHGHPTPGISRWRRCPLSMAAVDTGVLRRAKLQARRRWMTQRGRHQTPSPTSGIGRLRHPRGCSRPPVAWSNVAPSQCAPCALALDGGS